MTVIECIPYKSFKEKIKITKDIKGKPLITIDPKFIILEWRNEECTQ